MPAEQRATVRRDEIPASADSEPLAGRSDEAQPGESKVPEDSLSRQRVPDAKPEPVSRQRLPDAKPEPGSPPEKVSLKEEGADVNKDEEAPAPPQPVIFDS